MATILIVDDHSVHRNFLRALLEDGAHHLLEAADGLEALQLAAAEHPDLVITDIMMPRMDGYQFTQRLRAEPALAAIPVIFYTSSYSSQEASAIAAACGVLCVLAKPSPPPDILAAIYAALGTAQPAPAARAAASQAGRFTAIELAWSGQPPLPDAADAQRLIEYQSLGARLTAMIDMGIEIASQRDAQGLIDTGCRIARHVGVARFSMAAIPQPDGAGYRHFATRGLDADLHAQLERAPAAAVCNGVWAERRPRRLHGLQALPDGAGLPAGYPAVDAMLLAPIATAQHSYGWIALGDKLGGARFSEIDEEVLVAVAAQVAVAYESMLLFERTQLDLARIEQKAAELEQITHRLEASETQFRQLAENIDEVFFLLDARSEAVLYVSPAYEHIWGHSCASLYAAPRSWLDAIHADDRGRIEAIAAGSAAAPGGAQGFDYHYRIVRPDGAVRVIHARGFPIQDEEGVVGRVAGIAEDVTVEREQQDKLARLSRIYAVQSGINAAILRIHERAPLLREACRVAREHGAFSMAWIGLVGEPDPQGQVITWLDADTDNGGLMRAAGQLGPRHPAYVAARTLSTVVCNELAAEPELATLCAQGQRALAALPLLVEGRAIAVVVLFAPEANFFDKEERVLLDEMAADLSFGLNFIAQSERLNFLAYYDSLTGLPNRTLFLDRLNQAALGRGQSHSAICVVMLGLERFEHFNDTHGRGAGETLLCAVAQRLAGSLPEACSPARIVGDSFALLLHDLEQGRAAAELVERSVLDLFDAPIFVDGKPLQVAACAGVALFPADGEDAETLLKHAELGLRNAKSSGARLLYFAPEMNVANAARVELDDALRSALREGQFLLHYQPRVDLRSGRVVSAEALIRWRHPRRGMVPPVQFIPLCEETGLIVPIGAWVIDAVCAQQAAWREEGIEIVPVAVNLSAQQFQKGDLMQTIADALARHRLEQRFLEFELTESTVMADPGRAVLVLQSMKAAGAQLALDDFGTGYSSLAYLQRFPFDFVKIDRSFVTNLTSNPGDAAIVAAVIAMAHSLAMRVVAEGVETEGQLRLLQRLRCDQMQGYYFSPGIDVDAFGAMLREGACMRNEVPAERRDTVLVVDDEPNMLSALNRLLQGDGYRILLASSGPEGLDLLALNDVQVIIADQRMPNMSGTEFLTVVKSLYPDTIRIILSGYIDLKAVTDSVNQGAVFKFLTKPWDDQLLRTHIREAFRLYRPSAARTA